MIYTITLTDKELDIIWQVLQEWPYRIVSPIINNLSNQINLANQKPAEKEEIPTE